MKIYLINIFLFLYIYLRYTPVNRGGFIYATFQKPPCIFLRKLCNIVLYLHFIPINSL